MIERTAHQQTINQYDRGYMDALAKVEALIDKMEPVQATKCEINMVQNGTGMVIGELNGSLTIDHREKKTVTITQHAKEIHNIEHVTELYT